MLKRKALPTESVTVVSAELHLIEDWKEEIQMTSSSFPSSGSLLLLEYHP
jgi:hypothetical protein